MSLRRRDPIRQVFFIWLIGGIIGMGHLHHVIVGTVELLMGLIAPDSVLLSQLGHLLLWSSPGNILGSLLFAVLIRCSFMPPEKQAGDSGPFITRRSRSSAGGFSPFLKNSVNLLDDGLNYL